MDGGEAHAEHERAVAAEETELHVRLPGLQLPGALLVLIDGECLGVRGAVADDRVGRVALRPRSRDLAASLCLQPAVRPPRGGLLNPSQGATATIEVTGEAGGAELPAAGATVTAEDYSLATDGLVAGVNRIRFDNTGEERHHIIAIPYEAGATLEQIRSFATSDAPPDGPPPVDFSQASVTAALEGGDSQIAELSLASGKYAFICFVSDRAGGPPHAALGMINEVVVE